MAKINRRHQDGTITESIEWSVDELPPPKRRAARGRIDQALHPGQLGCMRCKRDHDFEDRTCVNVEPGSGVTALCGDCWDDLTPEQRLPFFRKLVFGYWAPDYCPCPDCQKHLHDRWDEVATAVLEEPHDG